MLAKKKGKNSYQLDRKRTAIYDWKYELSIVKKYEYRLVTRTHSLVVDCTPHFTTQKTQLKYFDDRGRHHI